MTEKKQDSLLLKLWDKAMKAIGPVATVLPLVSKSIKVKLKAGDVEGVRGHIVELQEAAAALGGVASHLEVAIADGQITLEEGASIALKLEKFIDELDDVFKGFDEDKPKKK